MQRKSCPIARSLRRRRSTPSVYKWFRRVRGPAATQANSPGLVDFAIGLLNSVLNLPDGQVKIFRRSEITEVL